MVGVYPASTAVAVLRAVDPVVYVLDGIVVQQAECRARVKDGRIVAIPVHSPVYRICGGVDLPEAP